MSRGSATALVRRPKRRFIKPRLSSWRYEAGGPGFLAAGYTIKLLDALNAPALDPWTLVDVRWTSQETAPSEWATQRCDSRLTSKAL